MTLLGLRKKKSGNGGAHLSNKQHSKSSSIAIPKLITTKQWPLRRNKNKLCIVSDNSNTINNNYDDQSLNTNHDDNGVLVSPPRVQSSAKMLDRQCISTNNSNNNNSRTSSMNTTNAIIEDESIAQRLMKEDETGIRLISKRVSLSQFIEKDKIALLNEEDDETTASISSNDKSKQSEEESLISSPKSDTSLSRLLTSNPHKNEEGTIYEEEEKFCIGKNNTSLEVLSVFIIEPITSCCNIMGYICDPIVSGDIFNMQYCGTTEGCAGGIDKLCGCDGNGREWEDDTVKSVNSYRRR